MFLKWLGARQAAEAGATPAPKPAKKKPAKKAKS